MSRYFGSSCQVAFVVPDMSVAIDKFVTNGVGPIFKLDRIRPAARYRGERYDPLISAALLYSGGIQYEILEQHDKTPSAYNDFIERHPAGGLHHIAFFSEDFDQSLALAASRGQTFEIVQEFIDPTGKAYEIYVEPRSGEDPLLIQLSHPSIRDFFNLMERAASNWDGNDPVRDAQVLLPAEARSPREN